MKVRVVVCALLVVASVSALARSWNPKLATADAHRDFTAGRVRFCYIGGLTPYAPGVPERSREEIRHYAVIWVGPKDCSRSEDAGAEQQYALLYNAEMWHCLSIQRR